MTIEMALVLARLKELHALARIRRAIAASAGDPDWTYCLAALDSRLDEMRGWLAREDPELLADAEREAAPVRTDSPMAITSHLPRLPRGARVH